MTEANQRILENLPVAELHCHIEATVEPEDARRLAARRNIDISGAFDQAGAYHWATFLEFLQIYDAVSEAIRTPEDYFEITYNFYRRMAAKGVIYGEVFVSPAHGQRFGMSYSSLIDAVASAMQETEIETGIVGRIIVTCVRHYGPEHALAVANAAQAEPHPYVTGFGMAGDEAFGDTVDFKPAFDAARGAGLGLTVHAGEILGPESLREAISLFNVSRVGHGVRAVEDESLIAEIKERGLTLEVCPTSNVAIGLYPSIAAHPLPRLVAAGLNVTLNSDDPAYFGADAADEYALNAAAHGFGRKDLLRFTRAAIDAAFCDRETKTKLRTKLPSA